MARNSRIGMFNVPNFLGGSSIGAHQGLRSAGLGGSSGSLVPVSPFGGGTPQGREIGATAGIGPGRIPANPVDSCMHSMAVTGQPTPCPPNESHQPAPCGPCTTIGDPGDPGMLNQKEPSFNISQTQQAGIADCQYPTSPNPSTKTEQFTWNTTTCKWDSTRAFNLQVLQEFPKEKTVRSDILGDIRRYGGKKGAMSRQELGQQFGRSGGGVGGGAMSDLEIFDNPLLAGGSPYLGKNVSQFAYGGKMRDTYNYGGKMKNPYKYPDGGRADFMSGMRRGMNSAVAAGQIQEVVRNNRSSRRFISGGKF